MGSVPFEDDVTRSGKPRLLLTNDLFCQRTASRQRKLRLAGVTTASLNAPPGRRSGVKSAFLFG